MFGNIATIKPFNMFTTQDAKTYRRKLALKVKRALEEEESNESSTSFKDDRNDDNDESRCKRLLFSFSCGSDSKLQN